MLFFVLSGFVLAMPWIRGKPISSTKFLVRRVFRLWPPVIAAVAVGAIVVLVIGRDPLAAATVARCVTLIGPYGGCPELVPPLWSLAYEARISLLFPLLAVATIQAPRAMFLLALLWGIPLDVAFWQYGLPGTVDALGWIASIVATLHYAALFVFGILLALYIDLARGKIRTAGTWVRGITTAAAVIFLASPFDMAEGAGAVLLIGLVIDARWILWPPIRWLGRVSFSLYLVHWPVLTFAVWLCGTSLPALALGAIASGAAAEIMYRLVEWPSMSWTKSGGPLSGKDKLQLRRG